MMISEPNETDTMGQKKLSGMDFFTRTLGAPKYVVAPMVDQSELAWRMLSRRYGAQLCYSPMFHSNNFCRDIKYRREALQSCADDRPLIIQFCGNDTQTLLEAAQLAEEHCDAIDLNLGCPQAIAKRGHYGSFLQDEWDLLKDIVSTLHKNLKVPVTCKIRVFTDRAKTVEYARMLVEAGCQMLTVHGRTREMKGPLTGIADWSYIKLVKENVNVPVLANGNIMTVEDVHRCLEATGADGVMTAEGNLYNPCLFAGFNAVSWDVANEYLDLVERYPTPAGYIRGHLFKIFHHLFTIPSTGDLRDQIATAHTLAAFRTAVVGLEERFKPFHTGAQCYVPAAGTEPPSDYNLQIPPWLCHSYVRAPPEEHIQKLEENERLAADPNTVRKQFFDEDGNQISRKRMKKLRRTQRRHNKSGGVSAGHERLPVVNCPDCFNPIGLKCDFQLCRTCCKKICYSRPADCAGHRVYVKTKREKARQEEVSQSNNDNVSSSPIKSHENEFEFVCK